MGHKLNSPQPNIERPWRWGCGCFGAIGCAALLLVVVALAGVVTVGLLFTAPPLEFMSQLNDFVTNELGWVMFVLVLLALGVGGLGGSFAGKLLFGVLSNSQGKD